MYQRVTPILFVSLVLVLQGCTTAREQTRKTAPDEETPAVVETEKPSLTFKLEVVSNNRRMARHLRRHLELRRFADFEDLQATELRRLLVDADENARDLLAAQGYFDPQLELRMEEPEGEGRRRIVIEVETGKRTRVREHEIEFGEPMNSDPEAERQRRSIRRDWLLRDGDIFTQAEWATAKAQALRALQGKRYPTAVIEDSQVVVNADEGDAMLRLQLNPGPAYRFGELRLDGIERYDATGIHNLARIPVGEEYDEQLLLDAQQRLAGSGYFQSVFLTLDTDADPDAAPVIAQLVEAKEQRVIFGLGYATDDGARFSVDHTHNRMWPLYWRARNQLNAGIDTQSLSTQWKDLPGASGWGWYTNLALERSEYGDFKANNQSLAVGRTRAADRTERTYYLQYDRSNAIGGDAPGSSSSLLGNYTWTGRYFDNVLNPTGGRGFSIDTGIGLTLTPEREPFLRVVLRGLQVWPFGGPNTAGRRNRLMLRAEAGGIYGDQDVDIPVRLLFLTGGDTTVRGYAYQSIGNRLDDGSVYGARLMGLGSVEWQRPLTVFGDARTFEHAVFVDAGTASDQLRDARLHLGVGTGIRYASPVGPLGVDVAYGLRTEKWRVHVRVGFQF